MSRTRRKKTDRIFRPPKTQGTRKVESYGSDEVRANGFNVPPRVKSRANPTGSIPDAYDDIKIAARNETDHRRK